MVSSIHCNYLSRINCFANPVHQECAQINIVGGSADKTPATVSFPGAYKQNDPGVIYNLYGGSKTYTAPGPAVFTC